MSHHTKPTVNPYWDAEALSMVKLLAPLVAGKTIGYRPKAELESMPTMNAPEEKKESRSCCLKLA